MANLTSNFLLLVIAVPSVHGFLSIACKPTAWASASDLSLLGVSEDLSGLLDDGRHSSLPYKELFFIRRRQLPNAAALLAVTAATLTQAQAQAASVPTMKDHLTAVRDPSTYPAWPMSSLMLTKTKRCLYWLCYMEQVRIKMESGV